MALNNSWNIRSRSTACADTGRPFEDGETVHAAIFVGEGEDGYERLDFCAEAWEKRREDSSAGEPYSHWQTVFEVTESPNKPEVVERESAEALLRRLIEEDEAKSENARYILALMLERKKILRQVDATEGEGSRMLFYEHVKSGEAFIVRDPLLKLAEVDAIQEEVAAWLGGGKPAQATGAHTIWIAALRDQPAPETAGASA